MARTYRKTAEQSQIWDEGSAEERQTLVAEIHEDLQGEDSTDDVDVLVDDGRVAFSVWQTV